MSALVETSWRLPPAVVGPCVDCGDASTRTLGRFPYCDDCADEIVATIRGRILARDGRGVGVIAGHRERDLGPRIWHLACTVCSAKWSGRHGEPCSWCIERSQRQLDEQRAVLLSPSWLPTDDGSTRYDELDEVDKRVWDRTRGIERDIESLRAWGERLARAVSAGLITEAEAHEAMERRTR